MTLHQEIDDMLLNVRHGWCSTSKAHALAAAVVSMGGGTVVELGLYAGRSFFPMALALRSLNNGVAIGVDPFDNDVAVAGEADAHREWWQTVPLIGIEQRFLEHLYDMELQEWTKIIRKKSDDVEPPAEITVLHIDGSHTDQAKTDAERFAPNVIVGGFCMMDDVSWQGGAVNESCQRLVELGFVERRRLVSRESDGFENDWALYQRIK